MQVTQRVARGTGAPTVASGGTMFAGYLPRGRDGRIPNVFAPTSSLESSQPMRMLPRRPVATGAAFMALALLTAVALGSPALAEDADHPADKPLVVGSDFGVAPWMVRGVNGPEGFGMDMIDEVAKRIGRPAPQVLDVNFSGLFAALFAKRIEFTVNPLNITAERA